jgi:hypothetical protein
MCKLFNDKYTNIFLSVIKDEDVGEIMRENKCNKASVYGFLWGTLN